MKTLTAKEAQKKLRTLADPALAASATRFFKTGPGEYGENDVFIGLRAATLRQLAKDFQKLALEEAKNGITVNVVNPSSIDEKELTLSEARRIRDARFPIGRPPTVEDVANAVAFFASDEAEYVTGQVVNVSGGWML